jgi:ATP-dependent helicase HrpA
VDENLDRRADLAGLEDRLRRRDIVCDDDALFELYDRRLPEVITSGPAFERWWRKQAPPRREQLRFGPQELLRTGTAEVDLEGFPDRWSSGDLALELEYRFEPGEDDDGVTVVVPIEALNQLSPAEFQWHIAGWRADLVTSLIRSLPKAARRQLVPASEHALAFLSQYGPADGPLLDSLARFLTRAGGTVVQPADFNPSALSPHLRLAFRVVDADGSTLAFGRDLAPIKADLQGAMQDALGRTTGLKPVSGATSWVFGTIPKIVERRTDGSLLRGYPSLVDEGEAVGLRVLTGPEAQAGHMWAGTRRLLLLGLPSAHADLERRLPRPVKLTLATSPGGAQAALIDCVASSLDSLVADLGGPPWDEAGFAALLKVARADLAARGAETARAMAGVLTAAAELRRRAGELRAERLRAALYDIDTQLEALLAPGFATRFGTGRLADIERYVRAAHRRLEKLPEDPQRDAARMSLVHDLQRSLEDAASRGASATSLNAIRWMIEELRVQLWAQTLGTSEPVSERRVRRAIDEAVSAAEPESALARAQDGR